MTLRKTFLLAATVIVLSVIAFFAFSSHYRHHREQPVREILSTAFWQHMASPGELSHGHAALENNCTSCDTPVKGVDPNKCIACHADNKSLLARQPSAFHAEITVCAACHLEHQGRFSPITAMDHAGLACIGLQQAQKSANVHDQNLDALAAWMKKEIHRRVRRNSSGRRRSSIVQPATQRKTATAGFSGPIVPPATPRTSGPSPNSAILPPPRNHAPSATRRRQATT